MCKFSRLETETETLEMPETRLRRDSRLVSSRKVVETESLADPWYQHSVILTMPRYVVENVKGAIYAHI